MKRGELVSYHIVVISLAVVALLVILGFLITNLDAENLTDSELCKLSVISRASTIPVVNQFIPLRCTTDKVCIGGDCESAFAGEDVTRSVGLRSGSEASEIEKVTAEELYGCWNEMGEGKLDVFDSYFVSRGLGVDASAKPICVICSRIALDDSVESGILNRVDIHRYLQENNVPGKSTTYLQEFTNGEYDTYPRYQTRRTADQFEQLEENVEIRGTGRELAIVFMQIKAPGVGEVLGNLGTDAFVGTTAGFMTYGSLKGAPGFKGVMTKVGSAFKRSGIVAAVAAVAVGTNSAVNAYLGQATAAGYCGDVSSAKDPRQGCSLVQAVPYDYGSIDALCHTIEGEQ